MKIIAYFFILFLLTGCNSQNSIKNITSVEIEKQLEMNKYQFIDFSTIGKEKWTRVCFFGPYAQDSAKTLGFAWNVNDHTNILSSDGDNVIVFATDNKIIEFIELARNKGDFASLSGECLERNNSILQRESKKDSWNSYVKTPL